MKRKILSLILVAALLASMLVFVPSTGASTAEASVKVTDATAKVGDTVSVDVIITTTSTLIDFQLLMEYDESKLTLVKNGDYNATYHDTWANYGGNPIAAFGELATDGNFYGIFSSEATGTALDATAGIKVATFTFTVNEGATGSAYVGFKYTGTACKVTTVKGEILNEEGAVDFIPGAIAILPDDYLTTTSADDFEITDVDDEAMTCTLAYYVGQGGDLVIPSVVDGYTVTKIGSFFTKAKENSTITSVIIPASVTEIAANAFVNCYALATYTILNADCVIGANALGWQGSVSGKSVAKYTFTPEYIVYDEATEEPIVVIKGFAGSTADTYVTENVDDSDCTATFEAMTAGYYTLTAENVGSYMVAADAVVPGAMVVGDKTVIAWTDGINTYAPGANMTLTADTTLTAITVTTPKTADGASIKKAATAEDLAIRFTADIAQADYAALVEAFGAANVKLGMLVTPQKYVNNAGAFTKEALTAYAGENAYVDIAVTGYHEKDDVAGTYTLAGSLTGFSAKTILKNPDFVAVAYISVDVDGDGTVDATVYGQYDYHTARNVLEVATLANDASIDATEKGLLATIIGWFTNGSKN